MSRVAPACAVIAVLVFSGAATLGEAGCSVTTEYKDLIGGSPGDGGSPDTDAGGTTEGGVPACMAGTIPVLMGGSPPFCIDATEVTVGQYDAFLAASPRVAANLPPFCSSKTSFAPDVTLPDKTRPVIGVDWCDAATYCIRAGKTLCGRANGASADFSQPSASSQSAWFAACAGAKGLAYPYGPTFDVTACNGARVGSPIAVPRQFAKCEGGHAGLFDMSGNVAEWENSCTATQCRVRGGSVNSGAADLACSASREVLPLVRSNDIGFRCCSK